jgi:A/G-specific adenine glycosylase
MKNNDQIFRAFVLRYWKKHGRHDLPWRISLDPYAILISEIMLQQTQVSRVVPKFQVFLKAFPGFRQLAAARTRDVLQRWQGLGYNRRALMLHRCAQAVIADHEGILPAHYDALVALPGIGPYTAGAILAFAFDQAVPLIETNIRRVYLHHFFPNRRNVSDADIMPLVTRDVRRTRSPRRWYSALMDYGSVLAGSVPNPNRRSKHYAKQSPFEGSYRQVRGAILRILTQGPTTIAKIQKLYPAYSARLPRALDDLVKEGFISMSGSKAQLV